ncbi:MAG: Hpt domain-containing protein, partial [Gammaproteobacteria bacterium]|nr:Hpt domain-containing protein [Gammaproteobacteria bacterium]
MNMTHSLRGLEWLVEELETSLGLAREALLTFQSEPEDASQLSFALGYLHQVSGSLTMAECYGAVLLANEMEAVLKMLLREPPIGVADACEALELTMLALPNYVRDLLDGRDDTLAQLMAQVNELRAVRAEPLISATSLFMPKVELLNPLASTNVDSEMLGKLQKVYQYALLGYLKQQDLAANQQKIVAVLRRLQGLFKTDPLASLWRVASAFFIALVENNISQSAATRALLSELDKTMGRLLRLEGPGSQCEDLLHNLLYYIALAPDESSALKTLKEEFALDQAFPSLALIEFDGALQTRLDGAVVTVLSDTLSAEITSLVDAFESAEQVDQNKLTKIKLSTERLATTLLVIGQIKLSQSLLEVAGLADQALANASGELPTGITRLQSIQQSLQTWAENYDDAPIASDLLSETAYVVDDAQRSLIREVRNNFESIKESIVGYIASQWDAQFLLEIPQQFEHIFGAVDVIGLKRVALIVEQLGNYITRHLLHGEQPPEWSQLDALADAITGFEYYLEAIDKGREGEQHDMLRLTAQAMEKLGFDVELPETDVGVEVELDVDTPELDSAEADDEIDSEIKEIFIEEAEEVLAELETHYPGWLLDQADHKALNELRRGFHTLKGSGRMVKANVIGDLAWAVENMLNKILDNSGAVVPETAELLDISLSLIPSLVDDFKRGAQHLSPYCAGLICAAEALTKGEPVVMPQSEEQPVELKNLEELDVGLLDSMVVEELEGLAELEGSTEIQPVVEIFVGEAGSYIDTLANFLGDFQQPHDCSRLAPADVQRALHTLQASAGMAGISAVQQLAKTFEDFLTELFARGQAVNSSLIILLLQGVDQLRTTLARLEAGEGEDSSVLQEYRSRVELARTQWQAQKANSLPPKGLARVQQLMVTGLDNVLLADTLLEQWSGQASFSRQDIEPVVSELVELGAAAEDSGVSALSALCDELARTLGNLTDSGEGFNQDALRVCKTAHELLLNMMDTVAIGQPVSPAPAELLAQLQALVILPAEVQAIDLT